MAAPCTEVKNLIFGQLHARHRGPHLAAERNERQSDWKRLDGKGLERHVPSPCAVGVGSGEVEEMMVADVLRRPALRDALVSENGAQWEPFEAWRTKTGL